MKEQPLESIKATPEWVRPDLQEEIGEIERVLVEFLNKEPSQENIAVVLRALESAPVVDLSEEDWQHLENTDSYKNIRSGHPEDAEKITEGYNTELPPENKRDFVNILSGFTGGNKMKMPTILKDTAGRLHLVSGNTRLMISRALNIKPKVLIGSIE